MSRRFRTLMILFLGAGGVAAFAPSTALADPPAAVSGRHLALDEALRLAEQTSPLVRRARAEREVVASRDVGAQRVVPVQPGDRRRRRAAPGRAAVERRAPRKGCSTSRTPSRPSRLAGSGRRGGRWSAGALRTAELRGRSRGPRRGPACAPRTSGRSWRWRASMRRRSGRRWSRSCWTRSAPGSRAARRRASICELARLERGSAARARVDATLAAADALARLRLLVGLPPAQKLALDAKAAAPALRAEATAGAARRAREASAPSWRRWRRAATRSTPTSRACGARRSPARRCSSDLQRDLPGQLFVGGGRRVPIPLWRRQQGELAVARADRARVRGGAHAGRARRRAGGRARIPGRAGAARDGASFSIARCCRRRTPR